MKQLSDKFITIFRVYYNIFLCQRLGYYEKLPIILARFAGKLVISGTFAAYAEVRHGLRGAEHPTGPAMESRGKAAERSVPIPRLFMKRIITDFGMYGMQRKMRRNNKLKSILNQNLKSRRLEDRMASIFSRATFRTFSLGMRSSSRSIIAQPISRVWGCA